MLAVAATAGVAFGEPGDGSFTLSALAARDKEDPRGRFSRALYPNHLTRDQVRALLENPPADGERLPVGPRSVRE